MLIGRWAAVAGVVLGLGACASFGDFASDDPGLAERPGVFEGRFLALSDADMAATAYANGVLRPVDDVDELALFEGGAPVARAAASNSVISWPQVVDASADGRFAYVVETKGPAPGGVERMDSVYTDFPAGALLSIFAVAGAALEPLETVEIGGDPQSVEAAPSGRFLAIATETEGQELALPILGPGGAVERVVRFDLAPPYRDDDAERRIRAVHLSPDGVTLAANIANRRIQFYRLTLDETGAPAGVEKLGAASDDIGSRIAVGKWTPDGRFFIVTNTNWDEGALHMLTQGPGSLTALRPPAGDAPPQIASRVDVGRSPEGFGMSMDGRYLAAINMERTYLPPSPFLFAWPGRRRYSVSLVSLDPETGAMAELDRVRQAGLLPEDVIFDEAGRNLAVAVFHRRKGPDGDRGFIDFFEITEDDQLRSQGVAQAVARGPHDLVRLP